MMLSRSFQLMCWTTIACCHITWHPAASASAVGSGFFDVRDYGAVGDGETLDTVAIQAAIRASSEAGGGTVLLSRGTFLSGTIELRDNVTLHLQAGAVLLASTRQQDFSSRCVIHATNAKNIAVVGRGTVDGHGSISTEFPEVRAHLIYFTECRNVCVRDVTFRHSTTWIQHYFKCNDVVVEGITVDSRLNPEIEGPRHLPGAPGRNEDGMNLNSCQNVRVSNCFINSDDDGIVLKSTSERPCRNVTIANCVVSSNASAIKCGTESGGGFQNITVSNCTVYDTRNSGIALEIVDGGIMDRINVSNIVMDNVKGAAIFIRLGNRGRPYREKNPGVGILRNVQISNIQATRIGGWIEDVGKRVVGCSITGLPGHPVEDVTLSSIRLHFKGGGTADDAAREIRERPDAYPSCRMFGTLPAYGFFVRHAKNIAFRHIDLSFQYDDVRPAVICDDVGGLEITNLNAQSLSSTVHGVIRLKQTRRASIQECRSAWPARPLLRVDGDRSAGISLSAKGVCETGTLVEVGSDVPKDATEIRSK
jgi:hypothetical protein